MHKLYELKEKLMNELEDYADNGKFSKDDVEAIKYTASAIDHICNIVERADDEYSMAMGDDSYENRGGTMRYNDGGMGGYRTSYARGRRNAKRDSMGRYSRDGSRNEDIIMELRDLMQDVPDDRTRQEFQKLIQKMEQM